MDISFLYKKKVAIDLWQWHCRNREEKNKIVGFHCFLTFCLLCMHHSRTYQCCWCTNWNLFVQGKLHFFHCFLTSCLSEKTVIPTIFFFLLFWQCHCHKFIPTIFRPSILAMLLPQINDHFYLFIYFFKK